VGGAVAGGAYHMGKKAAAGQQEDAETQARLQALEAQQQPPLPPPPAAPPAGAPAEGDRLGELKKLAELKEMGALTDDEFAAEKARILGN
jgi:hypothetical protein